MDMCYRAGLALGGLVLLSGFMLSAAHAETTPASSAAAEPDLPSPAVYAPAKPQSPVVDSLVDNARPPLDVRKRESRSSVGRRHVARGHRHPRDFERPALAGVELVSPLPPPGEPPHIEVPMPAYPLDSVAAAFLTPPPPVVCHRTRRDADAPDPHLYREAAVECVPDNP